jgi:hypothetical protein
MISSLLNTMANAVRPSLLRSSNERQTRLNFLPVSRDDAHQQSQRNNSHAPVATRRASKSGPLLARADDDDGSVKPVTHTPAKPPPPARTSSRKRPATALEPDATDTRPPTKITVTQPHGELLRITNGVSAPLGIDADDVPSASSTPRPSSSGKLAAPPAVPAPASTASSTDKRSLRSHDGGSRLKSDLAVYFANYDDIIAGVPKEDGTSLSHVACYSF